MKKSRVIVDTCFLQKLSSGGKNTENIRIVLDELSYIPIVHPYIAKQELALNSSLDKLVKEGYIEVIGYEEFIRDDFDKQLYEGYFAALYEDLRAYLDAKGGPKQMRPLSFRKDWTIYDEHMQGSSMADVHMILMASFLKLPILITEDSDIELLRTMARKRLRLGGYSMQIYSAMDLVREIAQRKDTSLTKKDLERILNEMGERGKRAEITKLWNESHA